MSTDQRLNVWRLQTGNFATMIMLISLHQFLKSVVTFTLLLLLQQLLYCPLDFVRDYPGEQAPER